MKNILLINCSFRKNNTYGVLKKISDKLDILSFNCEIINLKDYNIEFCKGCEVCILKGNCLIKDDLKTLFNKIRQADGIIIGTPVYVNNMSGLLKNFLDRTCMWFHRSEVALKPVILVATTGGSGLKNTLNSIKETMLQWGVDVTDTIGRTGISRNNDIKDTEIKNFVAHLNTNRKSYKTTFRQIFMFNIQKVLAINVLPFDKEYWEEKGWIKKEYFIEDNINVFKKYIGKLLFKILIKRIKPYKSTV